jgi:prepilin-type processing-associated H-X9-DG protein
MARSVTETRVAEAEERGISRRDLLRRAAVVGGSVVWMAPAIQTLTPRAYADVSPGASTCCQCVKISGGGGPNNACFANDAASNTLEKCQARCAAFHPSGSNYAFVDFHQDFPTGSGKSFSCVGATGGGTTCSPVPH